MFGSLLVWDELAMSVEDEAEAVRFGKHHGGTAVVHLLLRRKESHSSVDQIVLVLG